MRSVVSLSPQLSLHISVNNSESIEHRRRMQTCQRDVGMTYDDHRFLADRASSTNGLREGTITGQGFQIILNRSKGDGSVTVDTRNLRMMWEGRERRIQWKSPVESRALP